MRDIHTRVTAQVHAGLVHAIKIKLRGQVGSDGMAPLQLNKSRGRGSDGATLFCILLDLNFWLQNFAKWRGKEGKQNVPATPSATAYNPPTYNKLQTYVSNGNHAY